MNALESSMNLISFIEKAPTAYHSVLAGIEELKAAGFTELALNKPWEVTPGNSYYINIYGTTLFAFTVGNDPAGRLHVAASHTDYPCIKIKPAPEMAGKHYARLNATVYGGAILNTWLDRPLSVAGKVMTRSEEIFQPKTHMNRNVNSGVELNKQNDMLPLAAMVTEQLEKNHFFINFLAEQCGVAPEDILDFDLNVYVAESGALVGMNEEFISSPRIDNQTSVVSCLQGILNAGVPEKGINFIANFDNEEIGSSTKQGANSNMLNMVMDKLYAALGFDAIAANDILRDGFFLSLDVAHAIHPSHPEKCDPTNQPSMNAGIVLKMDAGQRYATDTQAIAAFRQLCDNAKVPYQLFVNRSDMLGGGTLGSITSAHLPMYTVDLGVPMLAMHSARELMGA